MDKVVELTDAEAYWLICNETWVTNGGYTWRNKDGYGQYLAYGKYPGCIRGCRLFTLEAIKETSARIGRPWKTVVNIEES